MGVACRLHAGTWESHRSQMYCRSRLAGSRVIWSVLRLFIVDLHLKMVLVRLIFLVFLPKHNSIAEGVWGVYGLHALSVLVREMIEKSCSYLDTSGMSWKNFRSNYYHPAVVWKVGLF
jgi:hypothetical protein